MNVVDRSRYSHLLQIYQYPPDTSIRIQIICKIFQEFQNDFRGIPHRGRLVLLMHWFSFQNLQAPTIKKQKWKTKEVKVEVVVVVVVVEEEEDGGG